MHRNIGWLATLLLVAACGGEAAPTTTLAPATTTTTATTAATTTTVAPSTTMPTLDCHSYGEAMTAIAQSFLYQTFDGGAAFERQQGDQLADSLQAIADTIADLRDQIAALGEPLPGYEGPVDLMLQAIDMDVAGFGDAAAAARAGDQGALDIAVTQIDEGFGILMNANVALSEAQACSG